MPLYTLTPPVPWRHCGKAGNQPVPWNFSPFVHLAERGRNIRRACPDDLADDTNFRAAIAGAKWIWMTGGIASFYHGATKMVKFEAQIRKVGIV